VLLSKFIATSEAINASFRLIFIFDCCSGQVSSSYLSVTVYVEDVNDHAPAFLGTPYHVTVDELTPAGKPKINKLD